MNIRERKIELRKDMEQRRASLSAEERADKQRRINAGLLELASRYLAADRPGGAAPTLLTYMPHRSEPDITPLMEWCWRQGVRVLLPRVAKDTKAMSLHRVSGYKDLDSGAYGIREPRPHTPVETNLATISLILVPGLAFDAGFGRLGYGGGYYDRFMQLFAARGLERPAAIAAAFDLQLIEQVPTSWHDFRVDGLITESKQLLKTEKR